MRVLKLAVPSLVLLLAFAPSAGARSNTADIVPGRYIVTFDNSVSSVSRETASLERRGGFNAKYSYGHALRGFAAGLNPAQVRELKLDPDVTSVVPDRFVHATAEVYPTGIRRIRASIDRSTNPASAVNVAVIDTGIDLANTDLNAVSGTNCVNPGSPANDDNGHGTHVAGTIAARGDNGSGVVGVVPGTTVYAVKVLDRRGSGTWSQVICGIDWVTANAVGDNIQVANMSLGGSGTSADMNPCGGSTALHGAICNSTKRVAYAVAAGNSGWDFDDASAPDVPAAYPEVLTVSAMSDSNGQPGAGGSKPTCRTGEYDDRYASFSNWAATAGGRAHTLAAPGVCILSDWIGGGTNTISGTSMATPHVAGAIAHCDGNWGDLPGVCAELRNPADLIPKISSTEPSYGYVGDPFQPVSGRYFGYETLAVPPPAPVPAPDFTLSASPASPTVNRGSRAAFDVTIASSGAYSVNLSVSGLPARTSASFLPNPATTSSTLTVSTNKRSSAGTFTLTIAGTTGGVTRTTSVTLTLR